MKILVNVNQMVERAAGDKLSPLTQNNNKVAVAAFKVGYRNAIQDIHLHPDVIVADRKLVRGFNDMVASFVASHGVRKEWDEHFQNHPEIHERWEDIETELYKFDKDETDI